MGTYGWLFDAKRCIECRACEAACKQWNGVETGVGVRYRLVSITDQGSYPKISRQALSISCNHCENALCAKACPVKAYTVRADGVVILNKDRCVGCGMCLKFCPYSGPQFNTRTRRMEKCTMCVDRIEQNQEPACATICPTEALQWGKWEEIAGKGVDRVSGFNTPRTTRPRIRFVSEPYPAG
jgi:Fe-S-cluster-containing dehydrogenase component